MIHRIALADFKCFTRAEIELGGLNVFAGSNGTGKSTVIQALLALFQSVQSGAIARGRLQLNGPLIELGSGRDVLYKRSDADRFQILIESGRDRQSLSAAVAVSEFQQTLDAVLEPSRLTIPCLEGELFYLSADRLGPQTSYRMNPDDLLGNPVGRRGEFAPLLYGRSRSRDVLNAALLLDNADKTRFPDLETQFTLWMRRLFPGFQAQTDSVNQIDAVILGMTLQDQIGERELLRPSNVGFGVSVAFPIILTGLLATAGTTLIVENPEAHLHPSAQSLLGEFLARVATGGTQVFVETHSDHVVNGMRVAFKNGIIAGSELRFFAFTRTSEYGSHRVTRVPLEETGDFANRPDLFFDQTDRDLKLIYGI